MSDEQKPLPPMSAAQRRIFECHVIASEAFEACMRDVHGPKADEPLTVYIGQDCGALGPPPSSQKTKENPDDWKDFNPGRTLSL